MSGTCNEGRRKEKRKEW